MNISAVGHGLRPPGCRKNVEHNIDEELAFHIERLTAIELEKGVSLESAKAMAIEKFGDVEKIRASCLRLKWKERIMEKLFAPWVTIVLFLMLACLAVMFVFKVNAERMVLGEARARAERAHEMAHMAMRDAESQKQIAERSQKVLTDTISGSDPSNSLPMLTASEVLAAASERLAQEFKDDPETLERLTKVIEETKQKLEAGENAARAETKD